LAEGVLEEVARAWKKAGGAVIVEGGELLEMVLKSIEGSMSGGRVQAGRGWQSSGSGYAFGADSESQESDPNGPPMLRSDSSFGMSNLEVNEEEEEEDAQLKDPREWVKVVNAFEQPRLTYNVQKKHFEKYVSVLLYALFTSDESQELHKTLIIPLRKPPNRPLPPTLQPHSPPHPPQPIIRAYVVQLHGLHVLQPSHPYRQPPWPLWEHASPPRSPAYPPHWHPRTRRPDWQHIT